MKKLGKLTINPEKIIKNEELVNLRGGYGSQMYQCSCNGAANPPWVSTWLAIYDTTQEMIDDINKKCVSGGTCTAYYP